jgi:phosphatidate cytidylyltransferase
VSDFNSINEAINKRAGRKLLPSIGVSFSLLALIWFALAYQREIFVIVVAVAVILGIREIVRAFGSANINISYRSLVVATLALTYATWTGGVAGLAIATAIAFPILLISLLRHGPEGFVSRATATSLTIIYLPFLAGFLVLLARPSTGFQRVMTFVILVGCNDTFGYFVGVLFGKHPLAPKISPKKSWEGLIGSIVFTVIGGIIGKQTFGDMPAVLNKVAAPLNWLYNGTDDQIRELLVDAMLDPKLAFKLMSKASTTNVEPLSRELQRKAIAAGYGATFGLR